MKSVIRAQILMKKLATRRKKLITYLEQCKSWTSFLAKGAQKVPINYYVYKAKWAGATVGRARCPPGCPETILPYNHNSLLVLFAPPSPGKTFRICIVPGTWSTFYDVLQVSSSKNDPKSHFSPDSKDNHAFKAKKVTFRALFRQKSKMLSKSINLE